MHKRTSSPAKSLVTLLLTVAAIYSSSTLFFWPFSGTEDKMESRPRVQPKTKQNYETTTTVSGRLEDFRDPLLLADKRTSYKYEVGDFRLSGDDLENWKAQYSRPEGAAAVDSDGHYAAHVGSEDWQLGYDSRLGGVEGRVKAEKRLGDLTAKYAAKGVVRPDGLSSLEQEGLVEYLVADDASLFAYVRGGAMNKAPVQDWQVGMKVEGGGGGRGSAYPYKGLVGYGSDGITARGQISADLADSVQADYEVTGRLASADLKRRAMAPEISQAVNVRYEKEPGSVVFGRLEKKADTPATLRVGYTVKN